MKDEQTELRKHIVHLLKGGWAHATLEQGLAGLSAAKAGERPAKATHSAWELAEHMRIAQWDILEFSRNPRHRSPAWPEEYWPAVAAPATGMEWKKTCAAIKSELAEFAALIEARESDLLAPLEHAPAYTLLREALTLADHNAYHLGQLIEVRKMIGAWAG